MENVRKADGERIVMQEGAPAENVPPGRRLVTVDVVAAKYGCDERSVFRYADSGRIPWGLKLGALRRWDLDEIDKHTAAVCMRVAAGSIKTTRNGGFLHRIGNSTWRKPETWSTVVASRLPRRHDLVTLAQNYETAVNPARLQRLADGLGLTKQSLRRLRIGWSCDHGAWSFPMTDCAGMVLGIRLRLPTGRKFSVVGGREGLFIPSDFPRLDTLFITEGPTDCAALLDLGFAAVGRPSCTGGLHLVTELAGRRKPRGIVIVADGDEPGRRGAEALADVLAVLCGDVRVITPPDGVKDARAWKMTGARARDVEQLIDVAAPRRLAITTRVLGRKGVGRGQ